MGQGPQNRAKNGKEAVGWGLWIERFGEGE